MSKLWTFGDSLTERFREDFEWSKKYIDWKGYTPKVYGELLSEELKMDHINMATNGSDNYKIFESICRCAKDIKEDDKIIIGWSDVVRFRLVDVNDKWVTLIPNWKNHMDDLGYVTIDTVEQVLVNRGSSTLYTDEVNSWIEFINLHFKNIDVIHWTQFNKEYKAHRLNQFTTIKKESNGEIDDQHYGEIGQKELTSYFTKLLKVRMI